MKKSMKKYLMLMLIIVAVIVTTVTVSLASTITVPDTIVCGTCGEQPAKVGNKVEPQCDSEGYTEILCNNCNKVLAKIDKKEPLGHVLSSGAYDFSAEEKAYLHTLVCTRGTCTYDVYETDDELNYVRYCKVNFINNYVAETFEDKYVCAYNKLAKTYTTETETLYVAYPENGSVYVSPSTEPYRAPDLEYGKYNFVGWNSSAAVTADTEPTYNLTAVFEPDKGVKYAVKFYNYDGTVLYEDRYVTHGTAAQFRGSTPMRADNVEYSYTFKGWKYLGLSVDTSDVETNLDKIYGEVKFVADYNAIPRYYDFLYYDLVDGELEPIMIGGHQAQDTVKLVGFDKNDQLLVGPSIVIEDRFDAVYDYVHTGRWLIPSRGDYVVDFDNLSLPAGMLDNTEVDIALVPQFQRFTRMYKLVVKVMYINDGNYHPKTIKLQVTNAEGKVIGYAEINQDADKGYYDEKTGIYTIVFDVAHSENYTVSATATGYSGKATKGFYIFDPDDRDQYGPGQITVEMTVPEEGPCNCICHTMFKPVWVGILNLLNSLFNAEFVCCDDMFANIGGELNYGPSK